MGAAATSDRSAQTFVAELYLAQRTQWGELVAGVIALPFVVAICAFCVWLIVVAGPGGVFYGGIALLILIPLFWQRLRSTVVRRAELIISTGQLEIWHDGALRQPIAVDADEIEEVQLMENGWLDDPEIEPYAAVPYLGEEWQDPNLVVVFRHPVSIRQRGRWGRYKAMWGPAHDSRVRASEQIAGLGLDVVDAPRAARAFQELQGKEVLTDEDLVVEEFDDGLPEGLLKRRRELKRIADEQGATELVRLLASPTMEGEPGTRSDLVWLLARTGPTGLTTSLDPQCDPLAVPSLCRVLERDPVPSIRKGAAWGLENASDAAAIPSLLHALHDANDGVRLQAIRAVGSLKARDAVEPLSKLVSGRGPTATAASQALVAIRDERALPSLEKAKRRAISPLKRRRLDKAIAELRTSVGY